MNSNTRKTIVGFLAILALFSSCKSFSLEGQFYSQGKNAARRSQFDVAVENLVQAVSLDGEYKKAILLLEETYPKGIEYYRGILRRMEGRDDLEALDSRADSYISLVNMARSIQDTPFLAHPKTDEPIRFPVYDYSAEKEMALSAAAEGHYQEGIRLSSLDERESDKAASKQFLRSLHYIPDYKDAEERENEARSGASQQLVFLPFRGDRPKYGTLNVNDYLMDKLVSTLLDDRGALEYTTLVDRSQMEMALEEQMLSMTGLFDESTSIEIGEMVSANIVFTGQVTQVSLNRPKSQVIREDRSKTVTATEADLDRTPLEGETVTVSGEVVFHSLDSSARLIAGFKLIDIETGTILLNETYRAERTDSARWISLEGDSRILSGEEKVLLTAYDREVKGTDELLLECTDEVAQNMAKTLAAYLR
jgi:hypothetical protein